MQQIANNTTNNNNTATRPIIRGPEFFKQAWILANVIESVILLGAIWALTSFIIYGHTRNRWRWDRRNRQQAILLLLAVATPGITIPRMIFTHVLVIVGQTSLHDSEGDKMCEMIMDVSGLIFFLCHLPTYFFLWHRQRMLYMQPSLKELNNKLVTAASWTFVVLLVVGGSVSTYLYISPTSYMMSQFGCVRWGDEAENHLSNFLAAGILITSQLILFGLFCHPLRVHKKSTITASMSKKAKKKQRTENRLHQAILQATVSMGVCIVSDTTAMSLVAIFLPRSMPRTLSCAIYDTSLFINILSVMYSYEDFRQIALIVFRRDQTRRVRRSANGTTGNNMASSISSTKFA